MIPGLSKSNSTTWLAPAFFSSASDLTGSLQRDINKIPYIIIAYLAPATISFSPNFFKATIVAFPLWLFPDVIKYLTIVIFFLLYYKIQEWPWREVFKLEAPKELPRKFSFFGIKMRWYWAGWILGLQGNFKGTCKTIRSQTIMG